MMLLTYAAHHAPSFIGMLSIKGFNKWHSTEYNEVWLMPSLHKSLNLILRLPSEAINVFLQDGF